MTQAIATPSQTVGPFFHVGLPNPALGSLVRPDTPGERIRLRIRVRDGDDLPVPDALVELRQADANGQYSSAPTPRADPQDVAGFVGFGRLPTDEDGQCVFETIRPGRVSDGRGGLQAPHITVCLFARGLLHHICTRIYFRDDPSLGDDALLGLVPEERRGTLLAQPAAGTAEWTFEIRLQGERETVFFDL